MAVNQKVIEAQIKKILDKQAKKTDNPAQARAEFARELAEVIVKAIKSGEVEVDPGIPIFEGRTIRKGRGRVK